MKGCKAQGSGCKANKFFVKKFMKRSGAAQDNEITVKGIRKFHWFDWFDWFDWFYCIG
jgi:hypothetical protein